MEFVGNIVDFGTAPEIHVTNICRAELISPNVIRFSYSVAHIRQDGEIEHRIVCHLDWDRASLELVSEVFKQTKVALFGAPHEKMIFQVARSH